MTTEEKLNQIVENERKALNLNRKLENALYGGEYQDSGIAQNPLYYAKGINNTWEGATFPEGFDCVVELKNVPISLNNMFFRATGVKTLTLICNAEGVVNFNQLIRESAVEVLDLSKFKPTPSTINYFLIGNSSITTIIGELDLSNCTSATYAFNVTTLKEIRFKEGTIGISIEFNNCKTLTAESLHSIVKGLSSTASGQTLTLPPYVTCKETYDVIYGDGFFDILVATKNNWTIAYK